MSNTSTPLVEVKHLSKRYPMLANSSDRLSALWDMLRGRTPTRHTTVLNNINFKVMPGSSLGIIGENGAGKSTLLKLITRVLTPSDGEVMTRGAIGALLELGAGFHPEYSGRENVRLAAALYGINDADLKTKMIEIEEFADIGHYIDEPTKHYSSGMVVRLGFAIIAAVRPPMLITDEVLGVGDESFQKKCSRWIDDYVNSGGTLLLVSHSMYHVQKLCREAIWLHEGKVEMQGDVFTVTQRYLAWHESKQSKLAETAPVIKSDYEYGIESVVSNGSDSRDELSCQFGNDFKIEVCLTSRDDSLPVLLCGWARGDETPVYGVSSEMDHIQPEKLSIGRYRYTLTFPKLGLLPGKYFMKVHSLDSTGLRLFETRQRTIVVTGESRECGLVLQPHHWEQ
ncbi:MAG: ABC transporter ATP-binding protein [Arenimonas sp.]